MVHAFDPSMWETETGILFSKKALFPLAPVLSLNPGPFAY